MRNGQNKRMRGRNNNNRKSQNPLTRVYESNGPDVKIRGTASHVAEKYMQLARDAQGSGDPVAAENYFQHAEHYFRMIAAAQEQFRQNQPYFRPEGNESRDEQFEEGDEDGNQPTMGAADVPFTGREPQPYPQREAQQPYPPREQPYPPRDHQPYRGRTQHFAPQGQHETSEGGERLPAFITGGGGQPQPAAPSNHGHGQNGFDGQPDRFPAHRRRRRRHGPRPHGGGNDGADDFPPSNGPSQD